MDRNAETYIVDSARELHSKSTYGLVIHLNQPSSHHDEEQVVGDAIRAHFARRALFLRRKRQQLLRRGPAGVTIRVVQKLGLEDDEMSLTSVYEQALRDGSFVVLVDAPTGERNERAAEVLRRHGAHSIHYLGHDLVMRRLTRLLAFRTDGAQLPNVTRTVDSPRRERRQ